MTTVHGTSDRSTSPESWDSDHTSHKFQAAHSEVELRQLAPCIQATLNVGDPFASLGAKPYISKNVLTTSVSLNREKRSADDGTASLHRRPILSVKIQRSLPPRRWELFVTINRSKQSFRPWGIQNCNRNPLSRQLSQDYVLMSTLQTPNEAERGQQS